MIGIGLQGNEREKSHLAEEAGFGALSTNHRSYSPSSGELAPGQYLQVSSRGCRPAYLWGAWGWP